MPDETPPESSPETEPQNESERIAHDVQSGIETAGQVAEGVAQAAEQVEGFMEGGGGSPTVPGALQGASGAVGGVSELLGGLGVNDSGANAVLGIAQQALAVASTVYTAGEQLVEAVEAIIHAEARIEEVRFSFEVLDGEVVWMVHDLNIAEVLGGTYLARLELCTEDLECDPNTLLGQSVSFSMSRKELVHPIRGIVQRVEHGLSTDRVVIARVEVVPAAALLGYGKNTRIFQEMTVPQILEEVLAAGLQTYDRTWEARLGCREYPQREYCTQRDESDWHFALRLMQEEGIACFFEHTEEREKLILIDDNEVYESVPTLDGGPVRFIASENVFDAIEPVRDLVHAHKLTATSITLADHDWSQVEPVVGFNDSRPEHGDREHYASSQPLTLSNWIVSDIRFKQNDLRGQLGVRGELLRRDRDVVRGRSVVSGMAPGLCFELASHPSRPLNQAYLLTEVTHTARNHAVAHLFDGDEAQPYENTFVAIPRSASYRPERTLPRPRVSGMESALVVGPDASSEIHTDNFRRVKVQFHWDRQGRKDVKSSCYLRVMQAWAGTGFGVDFLPRVGMEVVVSYLGGDPDRPFIAGCLYNKNNPPPYTAPGDETKSVIRTLTSPDDNGTFNELRFDDKKNGEEIFIHASRDMNEVVERNHTTRVKANQTNTVNGNQTETVDKEQHLTVKEDRYQIVKGCEDLLVENSRHTRVDIDETVKIKGNATTEIKRTEMRTTTGDRTVNLLANDTENVTRNKNVNVDGACEVQVGTHFKAYNGATQLWVDDQQMYVEAANTIQLKVGGSLLKINAQGIELTAPRISINTNPASFVAEGGTIRVAAPQELSLKATPASGVTCSPTSVSIGSASISSVAVGRHVIDGAIINIK